MTPYAFLFIASLYAGASLATVLWALIYSNHPSRNRTTGSYERTIQDWAISRFGEEVATNPAERVARVLEEAVELAQSEGLGREQAVNILSHVFDKPKGDCLQEAAGVGVTLYAYAAAKGVRVDDLVDGEVERILKLPPEHFRARHNVKAAAGIALEAKAP